MKRLGECNTTLCLASPTDVCLIRAAAQQSQSTPADLARAPSSGSPSSGSPQQPRPQVYPWSARQLQLNPPLIIPRPGMAQPTTPSPSPFPRYGHSLPPVASGSGELYIFGGLVRDSVRNDLYSFSTANATASLIQTFGDVPLPRVGHASAIVSSVLIIWGGDTKTNEDDKQDNALYLLNLGALDVCRVCDGGTYLPYPTLQEPESGREYCLRARLQLGAMAMPLLCVGPNSSSMEARSTVNSLTIYGHLILALVCGLLVHAWCLDRLP